MGWMKGLFGRTPESSESIEELMPSHGEDTSGYVRGKHYTEYVEKVATLKRGGDLESAERLLLELVDATEAEAVANDWGVAPWYYEQLAVIYRQERSLDKEIGILERFASRKHAPGVSPPRLMAQLAKAKASAADSL